MEQQKKILNMFHFLDCKYMFFFCKNVYDTLTSYPCYNNLNEGTVNKKLVHYLQHNVFECTSNRECNVK